MPEPCADQLLQMDLVGCSLTSPLGRANPDVDDDGRPQMSHVKVSGYLMADINHHRRHHHGHPSPPPSASEAPLPPAPVAGRYYHVVEWCAHRHRD